MKLTSLELSKKLVELGCRSDSGFYHTENSHEASLLYNPLFPNQYIICPSFSCCDLIGQSKFANKNRKILWKKVNVCTICGSDFTYNCGCKQGSFTSADNYHHHKMINHHNGWQNYLEVVLEYRLPNQ